MRIQTVIILFLCLACAGIGCKKAPTPLILKEIGPTTTKAGKGFNTQPGGESAIWARAVNATESTVIVWQKKELPTFTHAEEILTAPVPREFYARPGSFEIFLLDTKTGTKSSSMVFVVTD